MQKLHSSYTTLAVVILVLIICFSFSKKENKSTPPNFIIIYCDDLGYGDLSLNGHPTINTPFLDKMASEGMVFPQFYSGSPACTASRYALLTGKYPNRSGFGWVLNPDSPRGIHPDEITIAELLKTKGYQTAIYGKWHLGTTKKEFLPLQNGFDQYVGLPYSNDMIPPKWPDIYLYDGNEPGIKNPDQNTLTKLYTDKSLEFIDKNKNHPFFVYLPYAMPHVPLHPGQEFQGKSKRGKYGDVVEEIDFHVGRILSYLKKEGLDKNTLVFFTSDNGPWIIKDSLGGSSGLFRDGKGSTWEGGMRVPAIAWWPGKINAGDRDNNVTSVIDLFPTIKELAGNTVSNTIDGLPIQSIIKGDKSNNERSLFYVGMNNELYAVRKGKWKLHLKTFSQTGLTYFEKKQYLLFNLEEDPSEKYEIGESNPEIINSLSKELESFLTSSKQQKSFFEK